MPNSLVIKTRCYQLSSFPLPRYFTLAKISLQSNKSDERAEAISWIKKIEKFEFIITTVIQHQLLKSVDLVSKLLHKKNMNLFDAVTLLDTTCDNIKSTRNTFEEYISIAKTLATSWDSNVEFTNTRIERTKKFLMRFLKINALLGESKGSRSMSTLFVLTLLLCNLKVVFKE